MIYLQLHPCDNSCRLRHRGSRLLTLSPRTSIFSRTSSICSSNSSQSWGNQAWAANNNNNKRECPRATPFWGTIPIWTRRLSSVQEERYQGCHPSNHPNRHLTSKSRPEMVSLTSYWTGRLLMCSKRQALAPKVTKSQEGRCPDRPLKVSDLHEELSFF